MPGESERSLLRRYGCTMALLGLLGGCAGDGPLLLAASESAETTVSMDMLDKPLPRIPLPNDVATRLDPSSPTGRRVNASMLAPTALERRIREHIDTLDGWGVFQAITVPFSGPLDPTSVLSAHTDTDYDVADDVILLIDVDPNSPHRGEVTHLDVGNGNYPVVLEERAYGKNDPRGSAGSLVFEEVDEDRNGDGVLNPGGDANGDGQITGDEWPEDLDADGVLDAPNYVPGASPAADDLAARADAMMTFYERETDTLMVRPLVPLRERTTYAVVITRKLTDLNGQPVGSPYPGVHHASQGAALAPLADYLPLYGLGIEDVAFAWTYTTESIGSDWRAVRDGLYGQGVQGHIGTTVPPEMTLSTLRDEEIYVGLKNPYVVYTENLSVILPQVLELLVGVKGDNRRDAIVGSMQYIDFMALGSFKSPQLFERFDEQGELLPFDDQSWPPDLSVTPSPTVRSEDVTFWAYVPRKETSVRKDGGQAPVMIVGHGYTSTRLESIGWAPFFAKHGIATIGLDCPSHGLSLDESDKEQTAVLDLIGLGPLLEAVDEGRAMDLNGDGAPDSGADFWTSYTFHTRDMVRQCALDYMQLIRTLRSFDGVRTWDMDTNGDGEPDLAGDFDGDGVVDIGPESAIGLTGSSLGGIMASVVGALEPEVDVSIPVCGGGGLSDIGNRSLQGGVKEAVQLRLMAPLFTGTLEEDTDTLVLETVLAELNWETTIKLGTVEGVQRGDTVIANNLSNGERTCALVGEDGTFRLGLPSDRGDDLSLSFYPGPSLEPIPGCVTVSGAKPYIVVDTLEEDVNFMGRSWSAGSPLVAFEEGMGLRRSDPEFRRFLSIAQLVLDPADPAALAPHAMLDPLTYEATGTSTGSHNLVVTTIGDMNVPASTGISFARAAGLVPYLEPFEDGRYEGRTANQVLLDTYTGEAVHILDRFAEDGYPGVHMDVDNWSEGTDVYGDSVPRLDPPLRLIGEDTLCAGETCGLSGAIFPFQDPTGKHDIHPPGHYRDLAVQACKDACNEGDSECASECKDAPTFDVGFFFMNVFGEYLRTGGTSLNFDPCQSRDDCPGLPEPPAPRPESELL